MRRIGRSRVREDHEAIWGTDTVDGHSDGTSFAYTTYIHATPEQVWQGLTDPALTSRWWRHHAAGGKTFSSESHKGSAYAMAHEEIGLVVSDPDQVVLEADPYRRLAFTWHTFTPLVGRRGGHGRGNGHRLAGRAPLDGRLDIDSDDKGVAKLTVLHGVFGPSSNVLQGISAGWPAVLSSLKTMLETGSPLPW
jgi:uncharacterized protein YndB with AHSA1/START domain